MVHLSQLLISVGKFFGLKSNIFRPDDDGLARVVGNKSRQDMYPFNLDLFGMLSADQPTLNEHCLRLNKHTGFMPRCADHGRFILDLLYTSILLGYTRL